MRSVLPEPGREIEKEGSIFFRGYRYTLRDQDTTWPAAYVSVCRDNGKKGGYLQDVFQVWSLGYAAWFSS